ncbi:hypothetical protein G7046_g3998 [Stylonectria norvegica]|nr:hypothetical protein G7046_g3998 [Stylonectria norvegica]
MPEIPLENVVVIHKIATLLINSKSAMNSVLENLAGANNYHWTIAGGYYVITFALAVSKATLHTELRKGGAIPAIVYHHFQNNTQTSSHNFAPKLKSYISSDTMPELAADKVVCKYKLYAPLVKSETKMEEVLKEVCGADNYSYTNIGFVYHYKLGKEIEYKELLDKFKEAGAKAS